MATVTIIIKDQDDGSLNMEITSEPPFPVDENSAVEPTYAQVFGSQTYQAILESMRPHADEIKEEKV